MKFHVTIDTAVTVTKYGASAVGCWPLPPNASTFDVYRHSCFFWFSIIHLTVTGVLSCYEISLRIQDIDACVRVSAELISIVATLMKMLICKAKTTQLQHLYAEMQMFLEKATEKEKEAIQLYVNRCIFFYISIMFCAVGGPIAFIAGPLLTALQPFPVNITYPFSTEPTWIWVILYILQSVAVIQVASIPFIDCMYSILLWFAGARFEMLSVQFEQATNSDDITRCVQKHQEVIEFADDLKATIFFMALELRWFSAICIAAGGFVIIRNPPTYVMGQYIFFEVFAVLEMFLFTWPADNLTDMSTKIGAAAFSCDWVGKSLRMKKDLSIVIQKSQIPLVIAVRGVLPALSLELYASTMSISFSYLTTLRAVASS